MKPFQPSAGIIAGINFKMLGACIASVTAYALWPDTALHWPLGLISILLAFVSASLLVEAFKAAVKLYVRDRTIAAYLAQGARPKIAEMASGDMLLKAGMIDG